MKKTVLAFIGMLLMSAFALANTEVSEEKDFLENNVKNRCIQTSEYVSGDWVKLSKRQLKAGAVYDVPEYSSYVLRFGGIRLRYTETVKLDNGSYDVYKGDLDDGTNVTASSSVSDRKVIFIDIEKQHLKRFLCIDPKK